MGGYISTSENEFDDVTVFRWATSSNHVNSFCVKEYAGFEYSKEKILRATTNTIPNNSIVYLPYTIVAILRCGSRVNTCAIKIFYSSLYAFSAYDFICL